MVDLDGVTSIASLIYRVTLATENILDKASPADREGLRKAIRGVWFYRALANSDFDTKALKAKFPDIDIKIKMRSFERDDSQATKEIRSFLNIQRTIEANKAKYSEEAMREVLTVGSGDNHDKAAK